LMDGYVKTGGIMDSRDTTLDEQLSRLGDSREQLNTRMEAYSARLYTQFNAMDLVVASLNAQAGDIQSRIDSLPGVVRDNN
jgi:flagellar hook-associated protein 2